MRKSELHAARFYLGKRTDFEVHQITSITPDSVTYCTYFRHKNGEWHSNNSLGGTMIRTASFLNWALRPLADQEAKDLGLWKAHARLVFDSAHTRHALAQILHDNGYPNADRMVDEIIRTSQTQRFLNHSQKGPKS